MKQCANCGNQCEDNATFCGSCGSSLEVSFNTGTQPSSFPPPEQIQSDPSAQIPQPPPQQYPPPQQPYQQSPYQPHQMQQPGFDHTQNKYLKLGGWLLVVVIGNLIGVVADVIMSFSGIFETIGLFGELNDLRLYLPDNFETALTITLIGEIVGLMTIVFTILFLVQVFQRKSTFLRFHQLGLFTGIFYTVFVGIIPNAMLGMIDSDFSSNIGVIVGTVIGFFLFALYMSKSIRVRTYMGSDEYMYKAIFAFKNQPPLNPPPGPPPGPYGN